MRYVCQKCGGETPFSCRDAACPLRSSFAQLYRARDLTSASFSSSSYSVFVGRYGYPNVNVGLLAPPEKVAEAWVVDAPSFWRRASFSIPDVLSVRGSLVNSRFSSPVRGPSSRFLSLMQDVACARKPVGVEVNLSRVPHFSLFTHSVVPPMGPSASLVSARLEENPSVAAVVEKAVAATDLKASDALVHLSSRAIDETALSKLLAVGTLGISRKLVPTRWAITAVDDTLGKDLLAAIRDFALGDFRLYAGSYLGNHFFVLCFSDVWRYELFETYVGGRTAGFTTDFEDVSGRTSYAVQCAGGYYAARLAVAEALVAQKRQYSVLVLRFIDDTYTTPLGVWVVREAVRVAMNAAPVLFDSCNALLAFVCATVRSRWQSSLDSFLPQSQVLLSVGKQKKLFEF